jgi:hypothetical protein
MDERDELAAVHGIDRSSAVRLAVRHRWQRQRDKQRVLRVLVPALIGGRNIEVSTDMPLAHATTGSLDLRR